VVLRDGGIVEQGTLGELLRRKGVFANYYRTQFIDGQERPAELPLSV
jgi:ABC-type multidrug transport system fused ATPase/permease subunit